MVAAPRRLTYYSEPFNTGTLTEGARPARQYRSLQNIGASCQQVRTAGARRSTSSVRREKEEGLWLLTRERRGTNKNAHMKWAFDEAKNASNLVARARFELATFGL
jgi:hypothetical protein